MNSAIHYVENGNVHYAGNEPEKVLAGLVGGDGEQQKIQDFLHLPAQMALNQYAFECLLSPISVGAKDGDPQEAQMLSIIEEKCNKGGASRLRILDYGAGKGRLLQAIDQFSQQNGRKTSDWLDYYAWDLPDGHDSISKCEGLIEEIYGNERRHFTNKAALRSDLNDSSFDFVVMCNVLHEVPVDTWNLEIGPKSDIINLLNLDGALLIVEDTLIPIGEKAHKNGFLVLDKGELQKLCKSSPEDDKIKQYVSGKNDRLKAHLVPRELLKNIDGSSITSAIEELKRNSKDRIMEIRNQIPSSKNGKLHALWTQLFANASLVLEGRG